MKERPPTFDVVLNSILSCFILVGREVSLMSLKSVLPQFLDSGEGDTSRE